LKNKKKSQKLPKKELNIAEASLGDFEGRLGK
jgi:phage-related protein